MSRRVFTSPLLWLREGLRVFARRRHWIYFPVLLQACSPSRDSVLKDVELNFTATGFLDTDTFQVRCALAEEGDRLEACNSKLLGELVNYKARYDKEAGQRRTHADFHPFLKDPEASAQDREKWRSFYQSLAEKKTRVVYERQTVTGFEGTYRLRVKDLIYRVQKAE